MSKVTAERSKELAAAVATWAFVLACVAAMGLGVVALGKAVL